MKLLRFLLILSATLLGIATSARAQTQAVDPLAYAPSWTDGQRNVPFVFNKDTGGLLIDSLSTKPLRTSLSVARAVTIISITTSATGANFVVPSSLACDALDVVNLSAVDIEYRRGGAGATMVIPAGSSRLIIGITDASQVGFRRVDQQNLQISIAAEAVAL